MSRSSSSLVFAALALALGGAAGGCGGSGSDGNVYIALPTDFVDFRSWPMTALGDTPIAGHPAGPRFGYVKEKPGPTAYPVGAIIVKAVEPDGSTPQGWDIFAMAKRGGNYNAGGATNWEFFTLKINADNVAVVADRGISPADADADGGAGHGYSDGNGTSIGCNACHGIPGTDRSDHILSPLLAPPNSK